MSNGQKSSSTVARQAGRGTSVEIAMLEALEDRVMLSHAPIAATSMVDWHGVSVEARTGSWIVSFEERLGDKVAEGRTALMLDKLGVSATEIRSVGRGRWAVFQTQSQLTESMVDFAKVQVKGITNIEPNRVMHPTLIPNDPDLDVTWQLENTGQDIPGLGPGTAGADIHAFEAWDVTTGSPNAIVAVIDTGVDLDHPDLAANIWHNPGEIVGNGVDDDGNGFIDDVTGWDFGNLDNDPTDVSPPFTTHGTWVAGTIGAVGNNGIGTVGVAWDVSILPMKIADSNTGGLVLDAIINAHDYLTMMRGLGVNIVASNNSYGSFQPDFFGDEGFTAERDAIEAFINSGATFVAAAGNAGNDNDQIFTSYPASYDVPGIIAVAASDNNDGLAGFSNYGLTEVDLAAPGTQTYTTDFGGGYVFVSGTSFSSPITAGAVALLKTVRPQASAVEVRQALIDGVDVLPAFQGKTVSGGRLNIAKSLSAILIDGPIVTAIDPGPITGGPVASITVGFNKKLDAATLDSFGVGAVSLVRSNGDEMFGDGDDVAIGISSVTLSADSRSITITPTVALSPEHYQLTLDADAIKDTVGNYLNGDTVTGKDEVYVFQTVGQTAGGEPNDSISQATPLNFNASGTATITGANVGNGVNSNLDVDLYRLSVPIGGLITAQIDAKNLESPSSLDSYLRLFDAGGNEITSNDQFNNTDSFIQFFVTTGGIYYLGVSGFPNINYNPHLAGSGTSESQGTYNLTVTVDLIEDDVLNFEDTLAAPALVPDQGVVVDSIFVEDGRTLLDINVSVDIEHTFMSDLTVRLQGPNGTTITLASALGNDGTGYIGTTFDDSAPTAITAGTPPYTGIFRPQEALTIFKGKPASGTWSLIVSDTQAINSGFLNSWSLEMIVQNDIFGPFELNDTLATAGLLDLGASGVATRDATIGDGGFGFEDVDIYRFITEPGTTMTATLQTFGFLDGALRLFDSSGNQLSASNPAASTDADITSYTFAAGGVYYIGVSETANLTYDPNDAASGPSAGTTGDYRLTVNVTPGVADSLALLNGQLLDAAIAADGTFFNAGLGISLSGAELLGNSSAFYGAVFNGVGFRNDSQSAPELPAAVADQSDSANARALVSAGFNGLSISRAVSFGMLDSYMVVDVTLTNTSRQTMEGLAWMEGFNPTLDGFAATGNDVDGNLVRATNAAGLTIALAAPDSETRAIATVVDPLLQLRDPGQILDLGVVDPNGNGSDSIIALAYDLGDLGAGQTATVRYFVFTGESLADVSALYAALNDGTGTGHLTSDPSMPANDAEGFALLPFRLYHPEGYANDRASTFIPIVNPNNHDSRVVVIARYEYGERDDLLFDGTIKANSRDGITITTPGLYEDGTQLVRKNTPYAIEIRSELPLGATLSHFDFGFTTGESFTSATSQNWSFAQATKGSDHADFIVFYNPLNQNIKVNATFFPQNGGTPITLTRQIGAYRRGGFGLPFETSLPDGTYGVILESTSPIVAAISSFTTPVNGGVGGGYGAMGAVGLGSTTGGTPEGQFGLHAQEEIIPVLNANQQDAEVEFTFLFENGSAVRRTITVFAQSMRTLDVSTLPSFPAGQSYSVIYESDVAVTSSLPTESFSEINGSSLTNQARSLWVFADGFRPAGDSDQVTEYLRVFNPSTTDTLVEITLLFLDGSTETVSQTIGQRRVAEFDPHEFVPLEKRSHMQFYGLMIKAAEPVITYMGRSDNFFSGAFGTLGTPLGIIGPLV